MAANDRVVMLKDDNMVAKQRVLVAGATGYLGRFIVKELNWQGYWVRALIRNSRKIAPVRRYANECLIWPENPA